MENGLGQFIPLILIIVIFLLFKNLGFRVLVKKYLKYVILIVIAVWVISAL